MTTLLSFIGKGDRKRGYRTANYRFAPDFAREVPYFGLALQEYLKPDHLILAGTSGSMWDVFFSDQNLGDDDEQLLELIDAVQESRVDQFMLQGYDQRLSDKLGIPVTCLLIPHARNEQEQVAILQSLAETIPAGEELVLDVTHGFRHLPMLALVAARYLTHVQKIQVSNIYYGALEMTPQGDHQQTPVLELGSLLRMLDWVEALSVYDKSGDYGVFGSLLEADGMDAGKASLLRQAAFYERTGNPIKSGEKLGSVFADIAAHSGAMGRLFADALSKRINWFRRNNRADRELALAEAYFEHQDYLRATTYLYESSVTRAAIGAKVDNNDFDERKKAFTAIETKDHKALKYLRNSMAHGLRGTNDKTAQTLKDEDKLCHKLRGLFKSLGN
tara:strand:- start:2632 stop:3798 length:1167 start_codon:yes stop_codon:yes gene_type:complete